VSSGYIARRQPKKEKRDKVKGGAIKIWETLFLIIILIFSSSSSYSAATLFLGCVSISLCVCQGNISES
jgi:hypothetical protein